MPRRPSSLLDTHDCERIQGTEWTRARPEPLRVKKPTIDAAHMKAMGARQPTNQITFAKWFEAEHTVLQAFAGPTAFGGLHFASTIVAIAVSFASDDGAR